MRTRIIAICLAVAACVPLVALPVDASAAKRRTKAAKIPSITKVSPMRVRVGSRLTIRGKNFSGRRARNTVVFRAPNGRTAFAKPVRASRTKLVVVVPAAVARLLVGADGKQKAVRFQLRVLAGKFSKYTRKRLSPVIVGISSGGPGGGGANAACNQPDHDGDLLPNDLEVSIGTDPCLADTDRDQMSDGWEFYSAKDLNIKAVPYPGKRPFPNALDPSDGGAAAATHSAYDFDGDGLTTLEEYRAWRFTGSSLVAAKAGGLDLESPLGYSDGTKFSRAAETPTVPAWRGPSYGLAAPSHAFPATFNLHGDPAWRDDERDADGDGLSNWLEAARGPSKNEWWSSFWASKRFSPAVEPWKQAGYCGARPGYFDERPFAELDLADGDVDGDSLLDGEDDQDNDDFINITELYEVLYDLDGNGNPAWCGWALGVVPTISRAGADWPVNAMNPCVPDPDSRTCHDYIPF